MEFSHNEEFAYERGYRVVGDKVISHLGNTIKTRLTPAGYPIFSIWFNGKCRTVPVHRLVAFQKFGQKVYEKGIQSRHLDGNKLNFLGENIAIGTQSENQLDIPEHIRQHAARIAGKAGAKITRELFRSVSDEQVLEIRKRSANGETNVALAEEFGINPYTISQIKLRKRYTHLV